MISNRVYLTEMLDEYKESDECRKQEILQEFKERLWKSKCIFRKYVKKFTYKVHENLIKNDELIELFKQYEKMEYKVCKSIYKSKLNSIDFIRIHINNLYGYSFDKEVYYKSKYYQLILTPKKEYFKLIDFIKNGGDMNSINIEDIKYRIEKNLSEAEWIKKQCTARKIELGWKDYRKIMEPYIDRLFENYKPVEEYENGEWEIDVTIDGWDEDNYIISYFCKSLTGYIKNYTMKENGIKKWKKYVSCQSCGKPIEKDNPNRKYCEGCKSKILRERDKIKKRKKRNKINVPLSHNS